MQTMRQKFWHKLHNTYAVRAFDNTDVWTGNLSIDLDGVTFDTTMARAFLETGKTVMGQVRAELYVANLNLKLCRKGDIDVRLWTDVNDRGFVDERGLFWNASGHYVPMHLVTDVYGYPVLSGNNLIFESDTLSLSQTGVFHYTVEFSADDKFVTDPSKAWISVNDIAHNRDGVIVVSPEMIRQRPSVTEVCVRKVGARVDEGQFVSGRFVDVTACLEDMVTDVVYLLPFFEPGFKDVHTGEDVRKGELGSVYAVKDFFRLDPELVRPPADVDVLALVSDGLLFDLDLHELLNERQLTRLQKVDDFNNFRTYKELVNWVGLDTLTQLVGRAELRALTARAHELGKQVIFDLVLMQTSRDCALITEHPEWYVLDEKGHPRIHQIAWLVYSDVALLNLPFNKPLQNYLSGVAPFWMRTCQLDGVRIDASQTVDRPFLKQIKNRINMVKPDAIVLGETLCNLYDAVDIPVDMIYALLVDFHRDADRAHQYIDFLEHTFATFAPRTVAMAYFENHDSLRATRIWHERYQRLLSENNVIKKAWLKRMADSPAQVMALLRNVQCSLIDATVGSAKSVNMAYALEWGSEWGEEERTDFEHSTLLHPEWAKQEPYVKLMRAYDVLRKDVSGLDVLRDGHIYFFHAGHLGDGSDRVFAYVRYTSDAGVIVLHNLDAESIHRVVCPVHQLPDLALEQVELSPVFDTYPFFDLKSQLQVSLLDEGVSVSLQPLQSVMIKVAFRET